MQAGKRGLNGPWGRLTWTLPVALVLTTLSLAGFLAILVRGLSPPRSPPSNAVAMQIVELPPEPRQAEAPPRAETALPPAKPTATPKLIPESKPLPPSPVQSSPPPPIPTPAIETPPPAPVQPPSPPPLPLTPASKPLPLPPPPPPASPPRRETKDVRPRKSIPASPMALHRDFMRPPPQHSAAASSTEAAPAAPPTRSSTGGITMGARALYRPMPDIPEELRHRELALVAMARFHVAADGSATVTLLQATADPGLNANLMSALRNWRFFPAMANGRPIASTLDIRIPIEVK